MHLVVLNKEAILRNLVLAMLSLVLLASCASDAAEATKAAKQFAANLPGSTGKVNCTAQDTDGDGYCSCTVFLKDRVQNIECGCERRWAHCVFRCARGCKVVDTMKFRGKGRR